jgi:carbon monoxide dehydrogenase subunit G
MISASAEDRIPAPVDAVFAFMNQPANQAALTPSLEVSEEIGRMPNGGARARYVYKMAGMRFTGEVAAQEFVPNERIVFAMTGDIAGRIAWHFSPEGDATIVRYAAEYEVPGSFLARLAEPLAVRYNQRELEATLANLRDRFSHG